MAAPDEDTLLAAVKALRINEPALARAKVLKLLKEEHGWELSEKRLKTCMDVNNLNSTSVLPTTTPLKARGDAYDQVVKLAFQEFTRLERDFLLGLSKSERKQLSHFGIDTKAKIVSHVRHHLDFLLTVKGLKPCSIISHDRSIDVIAQLVSKVLKPVLKKYSLSSYGFIIRQVTKATMVDNGRPTLTNFWQGAWVFADTTSMFWPEIQSTFFPKADYYIPRSKLFDYQDKMGKLLGYPMCYPRGSPSRFQKVFYTDATEREAIIEAFANTEDICCVRGMVLFDESGDPEAWTKTLAHFDKCCEAMASVGSVLTINLAYHPALQAFYSEFC